MTDDGWEYLEVRIPGKPNGMCVICGESPASEPDDRCADHLGMGPWQTDEDHYIAFGRVFEIDGRESVLAWLDGAWSELAMDDNQGDAA